jgi:ribosome maturation factor RimP
VSRQLTHLFAVEDVDYARLEVSSPGLDRPLKRARDYERFTGSEIQVQLYAPLATAGGRKRLQGRLLEVGGAAGNERVRLELAPEGAAKSPAPGRGRTQAKRAGAKRKSSEIDAAGEVVEFSLADVDKAKLVPELNFRGGSKE